MDEDFLKVGDHICLYSDTSYGYLTSMSFNSPEIYIQQCSKLHSSHIQNLRNMVFEIVPKLSYDAMKELRRERKAIKAKSENPNELDNKDPDIVLGHQKKVQTLKRRVIVNEENNRKYMQNTYGNKVYYGMPIQLMHVDSGFFLQHAKKVSQLDRKCQQLELVKDPSPQRVTFYIYPRYKYRQEGEHVVYNDHVLLYNQKYNQYLHISQETITDQVVRVSENSEFRPPSPKRRSNPDEVYRRYEANMSQNYSKWQVIHFRQIKNQRESQLYFLTGDVIILKHAETSGYLCHDEQSANRKGDPAYVRIYKGLEPLDNTTTNCLFEIEQHIPSYSPTVNGQGSYITWKHNSKLGLSTQLVRLRHLNSGKLLTVKNLDDEQGMSQRNRRCTDDHNLKSKRATQGHKADSVEGGSQFKSHYHKANSNLILTLGENIKASEINRRFEKIQQLEQENKYNSDWNPNNCQEVLSCNQAIFNDQVFEIVNTIIDTNPKIKNLSVVKIRNVYHNHFISTENKKDGEVDEPQEEDQKAMEADYSAEIVDNGSEEDIHNLVDKPDEEIIVGKSLITNDKAEEQEEQEKEQDQQDSHGGKFVPISYDESDCIIFNWTKLIPNGSMDDVFIIEKFNFVQTQKILFIQSAVPRIKEFIYYIRQDRTQLKSPYMKNFEDLLIQMVFFVTQTESEDAFTCEGLPIKEHQKYFRELKVIDLLIDIIIYPFEGKDPVFDIDKLTQKSPMVRICQLIYRILKLCAKSNEFNKFYCAQWISHFFHQSMMTSEQNNLMAQYTIHELLFNNKQLLDKQINSSTIQNIVQNCLDSQKNQRFLSLLSALCSCNGEAISSNQDDICELLLENEEYSDLLIKVEYHQQAKTWVAIFNERELIEQNNNKPLKLPIEKIYPYFQQKDDLRLYYYYESMIHLVSLMCLQRNNKGIILLEKIYPLEFAIDCFLNENIPMKMRSYFATMLISLHIDKDPLEEVHVPILTRVWHEIAGGQTIFPQSKTKINPQLLKLKDFAVNFFTKMNGIQRSFQTDENYLTLQVLNIVEKMVMLGFYQNESEVLKILEPIISLLDGSNDFVTKDEEEAFNVYQQQLENWQNQKGKKQSQQPQNFQRNKEDRYKISEDNNSIVVIKQKIIDILMRIMDFQNDIRITAFLKEFNGSDKMLLHNPQLGSKELVFLQNVLNGTLPEEEDEMQEICSNKVIHWMKKAFSNKNLDMKDQSKKKNLICILLDIILYQDSKLVNSAFTLLTRYFSQKMSIIQFASEVQLLQDQQEVAIFKKVALELREMRKDAETSEFWMGKTGKEDLKKTRYFIDKLEMLTDLCVYKPNRIIDFEDKKKKKDDIEDEEEEKEDEFEFLNLTELTQEWDNEDPKVCTDEEVNDEKLQRLLRNQKAHEVAIIIIRQQALESAEDKNSFLRVLEKCYIFLIKLVKNNKENQLMLVDYLNLFIDDMEYGVHSWELIAEIFKNCELLLTQNLVPLIKRVIKLIDGLPKETQKKTTMLSFLSYFMKYNGNCIKEIQFLICSEITSPIRKNCDHLFVGEVGLKDLHLYILEMKNAYSEFMNDDRYVQEIQIPPELSYTIEYIKLLAYAGEGKNGGTETKAQEKLPIQDILENMNLADFCFPLKSALVYFMDSIYFDIEKDISDENVQKMYEFVNLISNDLERFVEIQQRTQQAKVSNTGGKGNKRQNVEQNMQPEEDLDGIYVDINKNFTMLTSFGSFPILYLIERYIFENVYLALSHYFSLRLPIKPGQQREFFKKFLQLIQKATKFVQKENHKAKARELFKTIKKIPQLKDLGGDALYCKTLNENQEKKAVTNNILGSMPQISQARKLKAYMESAKKSPTLHKHFEEEFEELVVYIIQITLKTEDAFKGSNTLDVKDIIKSLIKISDITSDIQWNLRIICLKVIRKVVELENKREYLPAFDWGDNWIDFKEQIQEQQQLLNELGVVNLICNLIGKESKLAIKEEALLVSVAILLGGNALSQHNFNEYIINDTQNSFMMSIKDMIFESFEMVKKTQIKRNNGKMKLIQVKKKVDELSEIKGKTREIQDSIKKAKQELKMLEEDLKDTEYVEDDSGGYTTDQLSVARSIKDLNLALKLHQLFCENHNLVMQNTIRQQFNIDGKLKTNSFDFPNWYAKMLIQFQKIFNNNTSDIGHQLVETLTECIQGPCKMNQKTLVNAKILDCSREYIAGFEREQEIVHLGFEDEDVEGIGEFKQKIVTLLTSLLEGEIDIDIMKNMAFSLDFTIMKERMLTVFTTFCCDILEVQSVDILDLSLNKINKRLKKESLDSNVAEAFEIFILMHSLADNVIEAQNMLQRDKFTQQQWKACEFIRSHMGRIEISVKGNLQRVYFPIRPVCHQLSPGARKNLMINVDRESQASKVTGLMASVPDLIDEMNHNDALANALIRITPDRLMLLKDFSTIIGLIINATYLFFAKRKYHYRELDVSQNVQDTIQILGWIQGASSGILIFFYAINKKKLITEKKWRDFVAQNKGKFSTPWNNNDRLDVKEMSFEMTHRILMEKGPNAPEFNIGSEIEPNFGNWFTWSEYQLFNFYFFIQDGVFQYYVLYFGISILGFISQDIYYSFHLLDVVPRFPTLQNVIKSVIFNINQLSLTVLLLMIIVYIYTSLTFFYIQDNMYDWGVNAYDSDIVGENNCLSMFQCYVSMLDKGLRFGGGIGDVTEPIHYNDEMEHYGVKLFHDATYHIIVKIIMLNVLFGIIIDTFALLRNQKSKIDYDMINVCFICNFERLMFDKYCEGGMERHIVKDHCLWNYLFYMVHLKTKPNSDHTGIESYVKHKYDSGEISWIPRQKAMCLQSVQEDEEEFSHQEELNRMMKEWNNDILFIDSSLDSLLQKIQKIESEENDAKDIEQKIINNVTAAPTINRMLEEAKEAMGITQEPSSLQVPQ